MEWAYAIKVKNPYFDLEIDKKFVFLLYDFLLPKGINLGDRCFGLFLKGDNVAMIDTEADYNRCMFTDVSVYEAFEDCIPDGMRYNKELDKLVPDVIEDKKSVAEQYFVGIDLRKKEIINERKNGFIKADLEKLDFSLVDPFAYSDLAFQLTVGAKKYSKDNWKKGDINIYLSALERHIQDIKKALDNADIEDLIDDTGIQHGGALLCNSMFIHYFIRQILKDKNVK